MTDQGGEDPELRPHDLTPDELQVAGEQTEAIESLRTEGHDRDVTLAEIQAAAQDIDMKTKAIRETIGLGVIEDNRTFRRRNRILMAGLAILLVSSGLQQFRYYFSVQPQNDRLEANTADLKNANEKLDRLVKFVERVEADLTEPTPPNPQLEAVFKAVFEIRELACAIEDPVRADACRDLGAPP